MDTALTLKFESTFTSSPLIIINLSKPHPLLHNLRTESCALRTRTINLTSILPPRITQLPLQIPNVSFYIRSHFYTGVGERKERPDLLFKFSIRTRYLIQNNNKILQKITLQAIHQFDLDIYQEQLSVFREVILVITALTEKSFNNKRKNEISENGTMKNACAMTQDRLTRSCAF